MISYPTKEWNLFRELERTDLINNKYLYSWINFLFNFYYVLFLKELHRQSYEFLVKKPPTLI